MANDRSRPADATPQPARPRCLWKSYPNQRQCTLPEHHAGRHVLAAAPAMSVAEALRVVEAHVDAMPVAEIAQRLERLTGAPLASAPRDWHSLQYTDTDYQRDIEELEARLAASDRRCRIVFDAKNRWADRARDAESSLQSERLARETAEQRCRIVLDAKNRWADRARDAEAELRATEIAMQQIDARLARLELAAPHPETRP